LRELEAWIPFLRTESSLPGPRRNLELAYVVRRRGTKKRFEQLLVFQAEEKWLSRDDKDIRWLMKENLKRNRLVKMDADSVKQCMKLLD